MAVQSDEDQNQWPGYVDALTTMTMMLIFIMVILAVAIFGMSQNVARSFAERVAEAAEVKFAGKPGDLDRIVEEVRSRTHKREITALSSDVRIQSRNVESTPITMDRPPLKGPSTLIRSVVPSAPLPREKTIAVEASDAMIRLVFEPRSVSIDPAADGQMQQFMRDDPRARSNAVLEIKAYAAAEASLTDARRIAFYRLMNVRAKLLAMGIPASRIISKVHDRLPGAVTEDVHVFVRSPA
jgi:Na+-transporting methylmalonyl-CoA/oxaloacetate decarboxylase gamma subunit